MELPRYSSPNVKYRGLTTGDADNDNVKQINLAAPSMAKIGSDKATCKAVVDNNVVPKSEFSGFFCREGATLQKMLT